MLSLSVLAETKKTKIKKAKEIEPKNIEYVTIDKFNIVADLYLPPKLSKKVKIPLIIMLHAIAEDKEVWKPYARELVGKGYSVLALDFRGHGNSIFDRKKKKVFWRFFNDEYWKYISSDVLSGVELLKSDYPQVNTDKIVIVGSSLGACVAVVSAEKISKVVKGLVLLSPINKHKNIEARVSMVNYGPHPVLIIVSKDDSSAYYAAQELTKYTQGTHQIAIVKNAGNGVTMLKHDKRLKKIMFDWLSKVLPPTPEPIPAKPKNIKKSNKENKGS